MNKISRTARSVTFAAVVGLSMGISAPGALAQDGAVDAQPAAEQGAVNKANINFNKKGSITLHKKKGAETDNPATGKEMTGVPGEALPCLLYTSPSPRDKRQSRMPSSA